MPPNKTKPNAGEAPTFSAGSVRATVFNFLDSRSDVEIVNERTLAELGIAPETVRAHVNKVFFPSKGLTQAQVTSGTSVLQLIIEIDNKLEAQGRLRE